MISAFNNSKFLVNLMLESITTLSFSKKLQLVQNIANHIITILLLLTILHINFDI